MMTNLEKRHYLASASEVERAVREMTAAQGHIDRTRGDYLKVIVANTQKAIGADVRLRTASEIGTLSAEDTAAHLDALKKVHESYYAAVLKGLSDVPPKLRNRKSTFARSAKSMLFTWMRAGFDVRDLAAARVTKASLHIEKPAGAKRKKLPAAAFEKRAMRYMAALGVDLRSVENKERAATTVMKAMGKLSAYLAKLGIAGEVTRDQRRALREGTPLETPAGLFMPVGKSDIRIGADTVQ